jgi:hypothetical protein
MKTFRLAAIMIAGILALCSLGGCNDSIAAARDSTHSVVAEKLEQLATPDNADRIAFAGDRSGNYSSVDYHTTVLLGSYDTNDYGIFKSYRLVDPLPRSEDVGALIPALLAELMATEGVVEVTFPVGRDPYCIGVELTDMLDTPERRREIGKIILKHIEGRATDHRDQVLRLLQKTRKNEKLSSSRYRMNEYIPMYRGNVADY